MVAVSEMLGGRSRMTGLLMNDDAAVDVCWIPDNLVLSKSELTSPVGLLRTFKHAELGAEDKKTVDTGCLLAAGSARGAKRGGISVGANEATVLGQKTSRAAMQQDWRRAFEEGAQRPGSVCLGRYCLQNVFICCQADPC